MMLDALPVIALGFFLGARHAVDPDHVIAVSTIVSRYRGTGQAALIGLLWGVGHTLTIFLVGAAIILLNVVVTPRIGLAMELAVGSMLIVLGVANVMSFVRTRRSKDAGALHASHVVHVHAHGHGDYVHTHPHGHDPDRHPHRPDQTPLASIDRSFGHLSLYGYVRPVVVGVVHGLAGSSAVALLVLAAIRDPVWATGYLLVFGVGTIAGMMLVTVTMASAIQLTGSRSARLTGTLGLTSGLISVAFGLFMAYHIVAAG